MKLAVALLIGQIEAQRIAVTRRLNPFSVFAYTRKIRLEEVNLNVAFGAEYDAYRRESWALVPGLF